MNDAELDESDDEAPDRSRDAAVNSSGVLTIRAASGRNEGLYVCRARNSFGTAFSHSFRLHIAGRNVQPFKLALLNVFGRVF